MRRGEKGGKEEGKRQEEGERRRKGGGRRRGKGRWFEKETKTDIQAWGEGNRRRGERQDRSKRRDGREEAER